VPYDLRALYLQQVAAILRDKAPLGDGVVHRVCRAVAHQITWDAARTATG
jgi:hypothetical protein